MGSLSNLYISQSYTSLIHLGNDTTVGTASVQLQDGLGNSIGVSVNSLGDVSLSGSFSASLQQGYTWVGDANNRTRLVSTSSFGGGSSADLTSLNAFTASQETKNSTLANVTASLNANTASQQSQINSLIAATASYATSAITASSVVDIFSTLANNQFTYTKGDGSQQTVTLNGGGTTDLTSLNEFTASQNTKNSTLASYTGSNDTKWNTLGGQTGSYVTSAITASSLVTASVNLNTITFTKGNGTTFDITVNTGSGAGGTDITSLNAFTASQETKNSTLASVTASLNSATASLFTSTSLALTTASFSGNTLTFTKGNGSTFGVVIPDVSGSGVPAGTVSGSTQIVELGFLQTSSFNSYTSSTNSSISQLNASSASQQISIDALNAATSSYATSAITASSLVTASLSGQTLTFTKGDSSTFGIVLPSGSVPTDITALNAFTASQLIINTGYNTFTQSAQAEIDSLQAATASYAISSSVAVVDAAQQSQINSLIAATGSYALTSSIVPLTSLNAYTASNDTKWSTLGGQSGSWVTSAITASSLITASAAGANITFTKGDSSQFTITVATGSFVSASYAETASLAINAKDIVVDVKNTTGLQINKGTVVRIIGATGDNPLIGTASWEDDNNSANTLGFVISDIANDAFGRVMTQGTLLSVNTDPVLGYAAGQIVYLSSSGQFTNVPPPAPYHEVRLGQVLRAQQNNGSIYVLIQNGYELGELHDVDINTGSLANNDLLAYDSASQQWENKTLNEVGATTTSSFNAYTASNDSKVNSLIAATGSYATTGSNLFRGTQDFETSANSAVIRMYQGSIAGGTTSNSLQFHEGSSQNPSGSYYNIQVTPGSQAFLAFTEQPSNVKFMQLIYSSSASSRSLAIDVPITTATGNPVSISKDTEITGALNLSSTFTASLQQGYVWVGDSIGKTSLVATSSLVVNTSAFATTGSNVFTGDQTLVDGAGNTVTLSDASGSLILVAKTFTSASSHFTASASNQINLIFKNSNTTADTIISGSNNIFTNPTALTAGFRKYIGNSNIVLTGNLMELTGSATYSPTVNNNYGNNTIRFRGPVSSSAWQFNANYVNGNFFIGNADATSANQAIAGGNMNNNIVFAATVYNAYTTPLSASANYTNNISIGSVTLTAFSSSIQATNNIFNGNSLTISNSYYGTSSTPAAQRLGLSYNVFGGVNSSALTISGSNTTAAAPREIIGNTSNGSGIAIGAVLNGDNSNLYSTLIHGSNLTVTGSSQYNTYQTAGSTFIGRNNDRSGTKANSAETVFAVGTGTSTSARKTGFLIDSGSNTFVEGTLNVSGATSLNGALNVSGGVYSAPVALSITSQTASIDTTLASTFTLTLVSGSTTHIALTNQRVGQTYNLLITQPSVGTGSVQLAPVIYQPSGSSYIPTPASNAEDILTFVTFNNTAKTYLVNVNNLI